MSTLSDDEKRARLEKRRPKTKMKVVDSFKIAYDPTKYISKVKKK